MQNAQFKMLFGIIKPFLSPDKIRAAAASLIEWIREYKNAVIIEPEKGECEVIAIFYEQNERQYFAVAILDTHDKIVRFEAVKEMSEIIELLISKM